MGCPTCLREYKPLIIAGAQSYGANGEPIEMCGCGCSTKTSREQKIIEATRKAAEARRQAEAEKRRKQIAKEQQKKKGKRK